MTTRYTYTLKDAPPDAINVMRPGKWGNPFRLTEYSREESLINYFYYLFNSQLIDDIHELRGKPLKCCCKLNQLCHRDILNFLANRMPTS